MIFEDMFEVFVETELKERFFEKGFLNGLIELEV